MTATAHCGNHASSVPVVAVTPLVGLGNTKVQIKHKVEINSKNITLFIIIVLISLVYLRITNYLNVFCYYYLKLFSVQKYCLAITT